MQSKKTSATVWTGRVISAIPVLFLLFDAAIKLANIKPVQDSFKALGYPTTIALGIGLLELACVLVYLIPRTSLAGAILLTGYLGGAIATHLRVGDPLFSHVLFPVYVGALLWGGLLLRDSRINEIFFRRTAVAQ